MGMFFVRTVLFYVLASGYFKESTALVKFKKTMMNYTAVEGGKVVLRCQFTNGVGLKRSWTNGSTVIYAQSNKYSYDRRISMDVNSGQEYSIQLQRVTVYDEGSYTCTIYSNPIQRKTVYLKVNVPARFTSQVSSDVTINEGGDTKLTCVATGKPEPRVTWRHIVPSADGIMGTGPHLPLFRITKDAGGIYECTADNKIAAPVTQSILVKVRYRPAMITRKHKKLVSAALGKQTVLECTASAYPAPQFTWKHYNTVYRSDSQSSRVKVLNVARLNTVTSKLIISTVALDDFGKFVCIAKNVMDSANATVILKRRFPEPTRPSPIDVFRQQNRRGRNGDGNTGISIFHLTKLFILISPLIVLLFEY